jgi:hypothetical protein
MYLTYIPGLTLWPSCQSPWLENGDGLCFLWGTNSIYICYVEESTSPLRSSAQSSWLQNGDVPCFLWGTNWIYIYQVRQANFLFWTERQYEKRKLACRTLYYVEEIRPPLWSSGQSSCLQIQRSGFDSRRYQFFWEVVGLERGPFSLVSTIEELIERKSSGSGLENRHYGSRDPSRWQRGTLYPQKLALTPPKNGGRSVCIAFVDSGHWV